MEVKSYDPLRHGDEWREILDLEICNHLCCFEPLMSPHSLQTGENNDRSPQFHLRFNYSLPDIPSRFSVTLRKLRYKLFNLIVPFLSQKIKASFALF